MSSNISGDTLHDLKLDEDRHISVGSDGDLERTEGIGTVEQSVAIAVGGAVRPLIGEPIDGSLYEDVRQEIETALDSDPQLESVNRVSITEIDTIDGSVSVEVFTEYNNSFEISISTQ